MFELNKSTYSFVKKLVHYYGCCSRNAGCPSKHSLSVFGTAEVSTAV